MGTPTRFPNGVTNSKAKTALADLPVFDPTKVYQFFDDFDSFTAAGSGVSGWHVDADGSPTAALLDAAGGQVQITNDTTATSNALYEWADNTAVTESFGLTAGKKAWLKVRLKIEDADESIITAGLKVAGDDPWATEPADQFLFRTLAAAPAGIQFACGTANTTEATVALGDLADDTFVTLEAYYDGKDTVTAVRRDATGAVTNSGSASVTASATGDLVPNDTLAVHFGHEAVDGGADNLTIDYIYAAQEIAR